MAEVKKGRSRKISRKIKAVIWLLIMVVGIPLIINWSYSLPFVWIRTKWGAAEVLDYYTSILGTAVAGLAILASAGLFVQEQKNQHDIQRIQETEKIIDQVLDVINPNRIKYLIIELPNGKDHPNYAEFREAVYLFRQENAVAVDRLSRSVHRNRGSQIDELITMIENLKTEIDTKLSDYENRVAESLKKLCDAEAAKNSHSEKREWADAYLKDTIMFQEIQDDLYAKFLELSKKKTERFDEEYAAVSDRIPDIFLRKLSEKLYTQDRKE